MPLPLDREPCFEMGSCVMHERCSGTKGWAAAWGQARAGTLARAHTHTHMHAPLHAHADTCTQGPSHTHTSHYTYSCRGYDTQGRPSPHAHLSGYTHGHIQADRHTYNLHAQTHITFTHAFSSLNLLPSLKDVPPAALSVVESSRPRAGQALETWTPRRP